MVLAVSCKGKEQVAVQNAGSAEPAVQLGGAADGKTITDGAEQAAKSNDFAFNLFKNSIAGSEGENVCVSPASAAWALSMLLNGAEGETAQQIKRALDPDGKAQSMQEYNEYQQALAAYLTGDTAATVSVANSIWVNQNYPVKKDFTDVNKRYYDAEVRNVAFNNSAVADINQWCSDKTNGKIAKMVERLSADDVMVLLNALYFKSQWEKPFEKDFTAKADFNCSKKKRVQVNMMSETNVKLYFANDVVQMTAKEMKGGYYMYFILPRKGVSIEEAAAAMADNFDAWKNGMKRERVSLFLPRFTSDYSTSLVKALQAMGVKDAFGSNADFDISEVPTYVSEVMQKTYVKVDEVGAEAAAVTSVMVGLLSSANMKEPEEIILDRPFIYLIAPADADAVLFVGKVENPKE